MKFRVTVRQEDFHLTDLVQVLRTVKSIDKCKNIKVLHMIFFYQYVDLLLTRVETTLPRCTSVFNLVLENEIF